MPFLNTDFTQGLFLGLFVWLVAVGSSAAWRTFQTLMNPHLSDKEI